MNIELAAPTQTSPRSTRRARTGLIAGSAVLTAADLAIKAMATNRLADGTTLDLGPINLRLLHNPGVAFSLGADLPSWLVTAATGILIAAMTGYFIASVPTMTVPSRAGAALVLGGAAGNLIDRLDGGGVVDYLHTGWFPTFNLADVFITAGAACLILSTVLPSARTQPGCGVGCSARH